MDLDEHDPLTTDGFGPVPGFDQTFPAAKAAPARKVAPRPAGVFRRLHNRVKARYLRWQLASMRARMDDLKSRIDDATDLAIGMALLHRHSPCLQEHRRTMSREHEATFQEWKRVQAELDALEVQT